MKKTYEIIIYRLTENNVFVYETSAKFNTKKKCIEFLNQFKKQTPMVIGYSIFDD